MLVPFLIFLGFVLSPFIGAIIASFDGTSLPKSSPEFIEMRKERAKKIEERTARLVRNILTDKTNEEEDDTK